MEVFLLRQRSIEQKLKVLFREGDDNGDGVLSFEEFNGIVSRYYTRGYVEQLSLGFHGDGLLHRAPRGEDR